MDITLSIATPANRTLAVMESPAQRKNLSSRFFNCKKQTWLIMKFFIKKTSNLNYLQKNDNGSAAPDLLLFSADRGW